MGILAYAAVQVVRPHQNNSEASHGDIPGFPGFVTRNDEKLDFHLRENDKMHGNEG
jgi:hypothetical protein